MKTKTKEKAYTEVMQGTYLIDSFSEVDVKYTVDMAKKTCNCIAFEMGRTRPCKHIKYIEAELRRDRR